MIVQLEILLECCEEMFGVNYDFVDIIYFVVDYCFLYNYIIWSNDLEVQFNCISKVIVFGDSFFDMGNIFNVLQWCFFNFDLWFLGYFLNGFVWIEYLV